MIGTLFAIGVIAAVWEPENRFRIWFEIEAHACDAQAALGVIPKAAAEAVWQRGAFDIERIDDYSYGRELQPRVVSQAVCILCACQTKLSYQKCIKEMTVKKARAQRIVPVP